MESQCDVLLISPPLPNFDETPYPPLGLAYVAAMLEKGHFKVRILDMPILGARLESIKRYIKTCRPSIVGIGCLAANYQQALKIAKVAKTKKQPPLVVMGGPHATFVDQTILQECDDVDLIVRGEGELTMLEVAEAHNNGSEFENILGITFKKRDKTIVQNKDRRLSTDIDELPLPARHLLPMNKYKKDTEWTTIISSRGCSYRCIFCAASAMWQHTLRLRKTSNVIDETKHVMERYEFNKFAFIDDFFILDGRGLDLIERLEELHVRWSCSTRVDSVSKDILKRMRESGCERITFGLESAVNRVLDGLHKGTNLDQVRNAVKWAKECGIEVKLNFMFGLPGETLDDMRRTLGVVKELHPSAVTFGSLIPYPGANVVKHANKYGIKWSNDEWWKDGRSLPSVQSGRVTSKDIRNFLCCARDEIQDEKILLYGGF